jgi:hypothetical protein
MCSTCFCGPIIRVYYISVNQFFDFFLFFLFLYPRSRGNTTDAERFFANKKRLPRARRAVYVCIFTRILCAWCVHNRGITIYYIRFASVIKKRFAAAAAATRNVQRLRDDIWNWKAKTLAWINCLLKTRNKNGIIPFHASHASRSFRRTYIIDRHMSIFQRVTFPAAFPSYLYSKQKKKNGLLERNE